MTLLYVFTKDTTPETAVTEMIPTIYINVGNHFCHPMELPSFYTIAKMYCIDFKVIKKKKQAYFNMSKKITNDLQIRK